MHRNVSSDESGEQTKYIGKFFSGKCLQDNYQKYNFIGEDCKAKCGSMHYNKHDEMFPYKNDRNHLLGLLTSSTTLGIQRSFAFYARVC